MTTQAIAVRMIAIGMRVDQYANIVTAEPSGICHGVQHLRRQRRIKQRINEQRLITIDNQPGI